METQTNTSPGVTTRAIGIRFGFLNALISVLYFLILSLSGINMTQGIWGWVGYAVTAVLLIFAHQQFKEKGNGYMSYGEGMLIAVWMGLITAVISSIFTYLYIKFIDTGFIEFIQEKQAEALQQQGMSDQQIDQALGFMTPEIMFMMGLIGTIAVTLIIALLVTIFTQKKDPEPAF